MRVRIIASKPRNEEQGDIAHLIGKEFDVVSQHDNGIKIDLDGPLGYFIFPDEYEVVEQKETP